jgi:hypothetical protein
MAGRKARLYDVVEKKWVDFDDLQTAKDFWKNRDKNPFITTGGYSGSRYSWDEPVDSRMLLSAALLETPE